MQLASALPVLPPLFSPSASAYANSAHSHRLIFSAAAIAALTKLPRRVAARPEPIRCQKQQQLQPQQPLPQLSQWTRCMRGWSKRFSKGQEKQSTLATTAKRDAVCLAISMHIHTYTYVCISSCYLCMCVRVSVYAQAAAGYRSQDNYMRCKCVCESLLECVLCERMSVCMCVCII